MQVQLLNGHGTAVGSDPLELRHEASGEPASPQSGHGGMRSEFDASCYLESPNGSYQELQGRHKKYVRACV